MRERKTHKTIPTDHPLYFCVQMDPGRIGKVWFRAPNGIRLAEVLGELGDVFEAMGDSGDDKKKKLVAARDNTSLLGGVIGLCWASPTHELETRQRDFDDIYDYGDEVIEELRNVGWRGPDFDKLSPVIYKQLTSRLVSEKEVEARADFFDPAQASST